MRCLALMLALSVTAVADEPAAIVLPHRTTLAVVLDTNVKTNRAHVSDPVVATLLSPVLLHGVVVIPKSAKLKGSVVAVRRHERTVPALLIVRFDEARWNNGSVKLNAYIAHQIIQKRIIISEVDDGCAPSAPNSGAPPTSRRTSLTPWAGCPEGRVGERAEQKTELTTPAMKDITVRRSNNPPRTIELVSDKKDIVLHRGTLLELRHLARPPQ